MTNVLRPSGHVFCKCPKCTDAFIRVETSPSSPPVCVPESPCKAVDPKLQVQTDSKTGVYCGTQSGKQTDVCTGSSDTKSDHKSGSGVVTGLVKYGSGEAAGSSGKDDPPPATLDGLAVFVEKLKKEVDSLVPKDPPPVYPWASFDPNNPLDVNWYQRMLLFGIRFPALGIKRFYTFVADTAAVPYSNGTTLWNNIALLADNYSRIGNCIRIKHIKQRGSVVIYHVNSSVATPMATLPPAVRVMLMTEYVPNTPGTPSGAVVQDNLKVGSVSLLPYSLAGSALSTPLGLWRSGFKNPSSDPFFKILDQRDFGITSHNKDATSAYQGVPNAPTTYLELTTSYKYEMDIDCDLLCTYVGASTNPWTNQLSNVVWGDFNTNYATIHTAHSCELSFVDVADQ